MTQPWLVAAGVMAFWAFVSFALARTAEARAAQKPPAISWFATASAVAAGMAAMRFRSTPATATACGCACIALIAAADSDSRTGYLFDAVTVPSAIVATIAAIVAGAAIDAACGIALLAGGFGAIVFFSRGRLMGLGDVKAMVAIGAAFGPIDSLIAIFAACVFGIAAAALRGRLKRGASLRFGPHLAAGTMFSLVAGNAIVHRLMGL